MRYITAMGMILVLLVGGVGETLAQGCTPATAFVADVTIPDDTILTPGQSFEKIWRIKNTGDCTWMPGYALAFIKGEQMGAPATQPLAQMVLPGAEVEIGVQMTAPLKMGIYTGWWQMKDPQGNLFGDKFYLRIIVPGPKGEMPTSPGGPGVIAFTVLNPQHQPIALYDLHICNVDGSGCKLIATGAHQPHFRPSDGALIANGEGFPDREHLIVVFPDGKWSGERWQEASLYASDSRPKWNPDSLRILIWNPDNNNIVIQEGMDVPKYVREDPKFNLNAAYHPLPYPMFNVSGRHPVWMSGDRVLYNGCIGADCGLIIVDTAGSPPKLVINVPDALSPDAHDKKIAFMTKKDGNWEIYTVNDNGSGLARLTNDPAEDGLPTWSPDGIQIAFLSKRTGQWAVWVMNPDGSGQRRLFDIGGEMRDNWPDETLAWWGASVPGPAPAVKPPPASPTPAPSPGIRPRPPTAETLTEKEALDLITKELLAEGFIGIGEFSNLDTGERILSVIYFSSKGPDSFEFQAEQRKVGFVAASIFARISPQPQFLGLGPMTAGSEMMEEEIAIIMADSIASWASGQITDDEFYALWLWPSKRGVLPPPPGAPPTAPTPVPMPATPPRPPTPTPTSVPLAPPTDKAIITITSYINCDLHINFGGGFIELDIKNGESKTVELEANKEYSVTINGPCIDQWGQVLKFGPGYWNWPLRIGG